jgi:acetolactate synthase I/III small subunit
MRHTISVLVENEFGVLARIAGLFSGRGYNIDCLTVSETMDSTISRMTIITQGDERVIEQILKQLNRLINVIKVEDVTEKPIIERELILVKVKSDESTRSKLLEVIEAFDGHIVDDMEQTSIIEFSGDASALQRILEALKPYGILEFLSSGHIAMGVGKAVMSVD